MLSALKKILSYGLLILFSTALCNVSVAAVANSVNPASSVLNAPQKTVRVGYFEFPGYHDIDGEGIYSG